MERFRPGRVDVVPPALLAAAGVGEIVAAGYDRAPVGIAACLAAAAVLVFARRIPLVVAPLVASVFAAAALAGFDVSAPAAWIPLLAFAFFATGLHASPARRPLGLGVVALAAAIAYGALTWLTDFEPSVVFGFALALGSWGLGVALERALERERRLGEESERARLDVALARERAVVGERERVASELHDVLAHALGAMVVQAAAARDVVRARSDDAARILADVAEAGRGALAETAALVRALRDRDARGGEPEPRVSAAARPVAPADALLPALLAAVATVEILANDYGPLAAGLGANWLASAALVARRSLPLAVPAIVTVLILGAGLLGFRSEEMAASAALVGLACFAAGRHVVQPWRSLAAVIAAAVLLLADVARREAVSPDVLLLLVFTFAPWALGVALRAALARAREHAAEAENTRLEAAAEAERAAAAERRRIARELHDLLASSLSVMVVQASLAAELVRADPDRAEAAVEEVERAGRAALERTGGLLRLIRAGNLETPPQHDAGDLPALVAEYERAGLEVELVGAGLADLPAGVGASVYRIVQEALTNALKHAPGSHVEIRLTRSASGVDVEVASSAARDDSRTPVASGHGLTGLRERVALYGGRLDARPTGDGGFLLAASMPLAGER